VNKHGEGKKDNNARDIPPFSEHAKADAEVPDTAPNEADDKDKVESVFPSPVTFVSVVSELLGSLALRFKDMFEEKRYIPSFFTQIHFGAFKP